MAHDPFQLSAYGRASTRPSPVNRMMSSVAADFRPGKDINLGVGYVNEKTIPADQVRDALHTVLDRSGIGPAALNYGGPRGSANLIRALRRHLAENRIGGLTSELLDRLDLIIGPSGATSLLEGLARVLQPGIVITPDPMYYIYCDFLERAGYEVCTVPEDGDGIRTDLVRETLANLGPRLGQVSFFYVVTINNPTGTILSNRRRRELVEIAADASHQAGRSIPLIFDRAYEDLVHSAPPPALESGLLHDQHGIVFEVNTLSKIISPALRIGYLLGPPGELMQALVQKTSDTGFSAPLITQEIAACLLDTSITAQIETVLRAYADTAREVGNRLRARLGTHLEELSGGQAGFYFYLTVRDIETVEGSPFFRFLTRTTGDPHIDGPPESQHPRILYLPGEFCVHPRGPLVRRGRRQLRLSYGYEELERIETAVDCMRAAIEYAARKH